MARLVTPITLAGALGPMSRPLAGVVAAWMKDDRWRVRLVRLIMPRLARDLDALVAGIEISIGPVR